MKTVFEYTEGMREKEMHYCPGCTHGIAHRLIMEVLDEKGVIVDWENHKKHITFKFKDKKKKSIRLANLEKTFQDETFKKEYLEQQFLVNQKMQEIGDVTIKVNSKTEKSTEEKYQDLLNKKKEQDRLAEEREKKQKQEIEKTKKRDRGFGIGD